MKLGACIYIGKRDLDQPRRLYCTKKVQSTEDWYLVAVVPLFDYFSPILPAIRPLGVGEENGRIYAHANTHVGNRLLLW